MAMYCASVVGIHDHRFKHIFMPIANVKYDSRICSRTVQFYDS